MSRPSRLLVSRKDRRRSSRKHTIGLADAERLVFGSQLKLDEGDYAQADALAYKAMLQAAIALVRTEFQDVADDPNTIVNEFRARFYDTNLLSDRYAGNKFAQYLFRRHDSPTRQHTHDHAHRIVEEAQLFIEAVYACHDSIKERGTAFAFGKPPVQVGKAAR